MPGALVETLAAGTALLPPQGLDRTTGQQAVPSWGCACSQSLPAPGPRMSMQHWTCVTPTLRPFWSKEQQGEVRRRERKNPAHMTPYEMGRCTPTSVD